MRHRRPGESGAGGGAGDPPHVRRDPAPGPRRLGRVHRGRHRPGRTPAQHHRHRRRSPAADQRRRQHRGGDERGDLQLPRAPPRAGGARAPLPHPHRHRGPGPSLRAAWRGHAAPAARDVRLRNLGPEPPPAPARPRPLRAEAALLHRIAGPPDLRLGGEGAPGRRSEPGGAVAARARPVPHPSIRAAAGDVLPAHPRTASGALHGVGGRSRRESSATGSSPTGPSGPRARRSCWSGSTHSWRKR